MQGSFGDPGNYETKMKMAEVEETTSGCFLIKSTSINLVYGKNFLRKFI